MTIAMKPTFSRRMPAMSSHTRLDVAEVEVTVAAARGADAHDGELAVANGRTVICRRAELALGNRRRDHPIEIFLHDGAFAGVDQVRLASFKSTPTTVWPA